MAGMRSRWAAIGAAVAVSLGAGGLATAVADHAGNQSSFTPITPVRVLDTRDGTGVVGGSTAPLGPNSTLNLDIDTQVPLGASGVKMNVTVVLGSEESWMVVYPKSATRPLASNLNWDDAGARPNLVSVPLGQDGDISFYNFRGTVHVVADLVGYYSPAPLPPPAAAMSRFQNGTDAVAPGENLAFTEPGGEVGFDIGYDPTTNIFTLIAGTYRVTYGFTVNSASSTPGTSRVHVNSIGVGANRVFPDGLSGVQTVSDSLIVEAPADNTVLEVRITTGTVSLDNASISIERIN